MKLNVTKALSLSGKSAGTVCGVKLEVPFTASLMPTRMAMAAMGNKNSKSCEIEYEDVVSG